MPILHIKALTRSDVDVSAILSTLNRELARRTQIDPSLWFSTWETIPSGFYCSGERAGATQTSNSHPPLVDLILFEDQSDETIRLMLNAIADVLCSELRLEQGNVFIVHREARSGRVYFRGKIIERARP